MGLRANGKWQMVPTLPGPLPQFVAEGESGRGENGSRGMAARKQYHSLSPNGSRSDLADAEVAAG